jgi:hypothetical protein
MGFDGFKHQNFKQEDTDKVCIGNLKTIKTHHTVKTHVIAFLKDQNHYITIKGEKMLDSSYRAIH